MLDLNSRIHFHEEMIGSLHDALKCGDAVQAYAGAKSLGITLHSQQGLSILFQGFCLGTGAAPGGFLEQF